MPPASKKIEKRAFSVFDAFEPLENKDNKFIPPVDLSNGTATMTMSSSYRTKDNSYRSSGSKSLVFSNSGSHRTSSNHHSVGSIGSYYGGPSRKEGFRDKETGLAADYDIVDQIFDDYDPSSPFHSGKKQRTRRRRIIIAISVLFLVGMGGLVYVLFSKSGFSGADGGDKEMGATNKTAAPGSAGPTDTPTSVP
jgi:hypothetical protein